MKKLLLILSILTITSQAQDGINYQGVATNGFGVELINQNISVQTSIISDSANGTIQWQETHSVTTDQFGLFNLIIGQGTSTGSGQSSSFDNIQWGSGNHYLKIEMDATGGSNYILIGTNQMMSVPYALYAKSAGIDSTMLANMINTSVGGMGGGCDFKYPDGLSGDYITHDLGNVSGSNYIVPVGKTLYITNLFTESNGALSIDGITITLVQFNSYIGNSATSGNTLSLPLIAGENQVISYNSANASFNGFIIESTIEPITHELGYVNGGNYIVPSGKVLIITNFYNNNNSNYVTVDGIKIITTHFNSYIGNSATSGNTLSLPFVLDESQTISSNAAYGSFNGYLIDEDYFTDCGGVRNSSTTVDSSYIDSLVQFYSTEIITNGSISPYHPEGLEGIEYVSNNNPYTVPSGKTFYMYTELTNLEINGINNVVSDDHYFPIPIAENSTLDYSGTWQLRGYLIEKGYEVINYLGGSTNYTVPSDSYLYILNSLSGLTINSNFVSTSSMGGQYLTPPYVLQPSDVVSSVKGFNGILIPLENLGSSSLSSNITSSSNSFNSNLSSGTLGVGSSYTETNVIDTILVPENSFVEIDGYYNRTAGDYSNNTDSQVFVEDLLGNTIDFNTVSSGGSSNSILSSNITSGSGTFKMKRFFSNETTIIIFNRLSGQHCCHAYLSGGGVSFTINGFTTVNSF